MEAEKRVYANMSDVRCENNHIGRDFVPESKFMAFADRILRPNLLRIRFAA